MSPTKQELNESVRAQLKLGVLPNDVAELTGVKLSTVYAISRKLKAEKDNEVITELAHAPIETIKHVVEEAKAVAPKAMKQELDKVVNAAEGLQKLGGHFQTTIGLALSRFDKLLQNEDIPLKDIKMITDTVSDAYSKVFAAGTNIHIGDNNTSSNQLTMFQNKMGV